MRSALRRNRTPPPSPPSCAGCSPPATAAPPPTTVTLPYPWSASSAVPPRRDPRVSQTTTSFWESGRTDPTDEDRCRPTPPARPDLRARQPHPRTARQRALSHPASVSHLCPGAHAPGAHPRTAVSKRAKLADAPIVSAGQRYDAAQVRREAWSARLGGTTMVTQFRDAPHRAAVRYVRRDASTACLTN